MKESPRGRFLFGNLDEESREGPLCAKSVRLNCGEATTNDSYL